MNAWTKLYGNPTKSYQEISFRTTNVNLMVVSPVAAEIVQCVGLTDRQKCRYFSTLVGTYMLSQNFFCILGLSWFRRTRNHLCIFCTSQSSCLESPSSRLVSGHWRGQYRANRSHFIETTMPVGMTFTPHEVFTEHIIMPMVVYSGAVTSVFQCAEEHLMDDRTKIGLMYHFGLIHPLQDIIGLSLPRHSRLNLKYVGTGLGH